MKYNFLDWGLIREGGLFEGGGLIDHLRYTSQLIVAMNETAVWVDMLSQSTVDKVGKREICLKTTGHEKVRISICLSATADGTKLRHFIVFGGAERETEALNKEFRSRCIVTSSLNPWMNVGLTLKYVADVGRFSFTR